jgi:nicotinamidase-related amidase
MRGETDTTGIGEVVNNTACLIIIDVQKGIFNLKQPVYKAADLLENLQAVIAKSRRLNMKIVYTQHENTTFLKKGLAGWKISDTVKPEDDDLVVPKKRTSAFRDTGLAGLLRQNGITRLFLAGLISNGCVKDSCLDATADGFSVTCIADAHSTFYKNADKIINETNKTLVQQGITLVTSQEFGGSDVISS